MLIVLHATHSAIVDDSVPAGEGTHLLKACPERTIAELGKLIQVGPDVKKIEDTQKNFGTVARISMCRRSLGHVVTRALPITLKSGA